MKRFLNFSRNVFIILIVSVAIGFGVSKASVSKRLDFGIHQQDFINGNCDVDSKAFPVRRISLWTCEFTDGCLAGWMADLSGANPRRFRWINKRNHGRLM